MRDLLSVNLIILILFSASCKHEKQQYSPDYQRAGNFTKEHIYEKIYHLKVNPIWFSDGKGFAYQAHTREGQKYYIVRFSDLKRQPAFDSKRLANALSHFSGHDISLGRTALKQLRWYNEYTFTCTLKDKKYKINLKDYTIKRFRNKHRNHSRNTSSSPDGQYRIYIKNDNLCLKDIKEQKTIHLSSDGSKYYIYGSYYGWGEVMKGENAGPVPRLSGQWSPDSKKFLTQIMDARKGEKMYLLNWSVDSMYRPILLSYYRSSPGDSDDVYYIPVLFDAHTHQMTRIRLPAMPHYMGIRLRWTKDSKHLYGLYYHRGYKKLDIVDVNPENGRVRIIYTDSSKTYIDINTQFRYLDKKYMAFITSEKSGWNQLYRIEWNTGKIHPVTNGNYVVKELVSIDTMNEVIYFTATGKEKGVNPYYVSLYRINFDGSGLRLLTPEPVDHEIYLSPNSSYFIDNRSTPTQPTVSLLRSTRNGKILMRIDSADTKDLFAMGWHYPQIFTAKARDGKTTIYGALWKPTDFNPRHHYPLIDASYTGPQTHVFPNTFSKAVFTSAQSQAELGFIVMAIDGLGTAGRSKAFHNWSYKNMGNNLTDHVLAIRQLGKKFSWIDTTRVGIYGHSAGGYDAAHALMAFNECYKVAVAESGDHDWRMEKAWWPEMFIGGPVDSVYEKQSNITMAPKLRGKLLLIHGGIDENVNPSATFKLCEALIKANKQFDLLIIPSAHHGYPAAYVPYVNKKRWSYFVQNLIIHQPDKTRD